MSFGCDASIAGAGPTGVTLAALLAKRGLSVIVAEKEAEGNAFPLKWLGSTCQMLSCPANAAGAAGRGEDCFGHCCTSTLLAYNIVGMDHD